MTGPNRMRNCPDILGGGRVVSHTVLTEDVVEDRKLISALAICQSGPSTYYLFSCDGGWDTIYDSLHETLEDAMDQAESQYPATRGTWIRR